MANKNRLRDELIAGIPKGKRSSIRPILMRLFKDRSLSNASYNDSCVLTDDVIQEAIEAFILLDEHMSSLGLDWEFVTWIDKKWIKGKEYINILGIDVLPHIGNKCSSRHVILIDNKLGKIDKKIKVVMNEVKEVEEAYKYLIQFVPSECMNSLSLMQGMDGNKYDRLAMKIGPLKTIYLRRHKDDKCMAVVANGYCDFPFIVHSMHDVRDLIRLILQN